MADQPAWPDPHAVVKLALTGLSGLTAGNVGSSDHGKIVGPNQIPEFEKHLPIVQVRVIGGAADKITATPRTNILTFAETYAESRDLAYAILQRLLPGAIRTEAGNIDRCEVDAFPSPAPWPNTELHVHAASYRLSFRR